MSISRFEGGWFPISILNKVSWRPFYEIEGVPNEEIEKLIIDDAPWVFSWHKSSCSVHQSWVNGYSVAPLAVMEKWNRVSLSR